jgi:hypothetical protein
MDLFRVKKKKEKDLTQRAQREHRGHGEFGGESAAGVGVCREAGVSDAEL